MPQKAKDEKKEEREDVEGRRKHEERRTEGKRGGQSIDGQPHPEGKKKRGEDREETKEESREREKSVV